MLTLLTWVRNLSTFKFAFTAVNIMFFVSVIIVCYNSYDDIQKHGIDPSVEPIDLSTFLSFIGFSCYSFSAAVNILPIMEASAVKDQFDKIYITCIVCLLLIYSIMGTMTYLAFGNNQHQMITNQLPQNDLDVEILIILFLIMVVFTFPIVVYPLNETVERWTLSFCF